MQERLKERQAKQKGYYDIHAKRLPELHTGDNVRMQSGDKWKPAVVLKQHDQPRSYVVCTPEGRRFRRNRKHLRPTVETVFPTAGESDVTDVMDCDSTLSADRVTTHTHSSAPAQNTDTGDSSDLTQPYRTRSGRLVKTPQRFKE